MRHIYLFVVSCQNGDLSEIYLYQLAKKKTLNSHTKFYTSSIHKVYSSPPTHIATRCNTLQRTGTHCSALQHTATLQHIGTATLQHICQASADSWESFVRVVRCSVCISESFVVSIAAHCNTLQPTAIHCNALHMFQPLQHSLLSSLLGCVARCCGTLQCVQVRCSTLQRVHLRVFCRACHFPRQTMASWRRVYLYNKMTPPPNFGNFWIIFEG